MQPAAAFQHVEQLFSGVVGRVVGTGIGAAVAQGAVGMHLVGGSGVQRRHQGAGFRVHRAHGLGRQGFTRQRCLHKSAPLNPFRLVLYTFRRSGMARSACSLAGNQRSRPCPSWRIPICPPSTGYAKGGYDILSLDRAMAQDIRELHIGLLNMMPDAALTVHRAAVHAPRRQLQPDRAVLHPSLFRPRPAPQPRGRRLHRHLLRRVRGPARGGVGRPDHFRRQRHPALPGTGAVLDAAAGGDRLGDGQRDEHPVLVPGHPRTGQAIVSDRPAQTVAQAVGGVQPPRAQPRAPAAAWASTRASTCRTRAGTR